MAKEALLDRVIRRHFQAELKENEIFVHIRSVRTRTAIQWLQSSNVIRALDTCIVVCLLIIGLIAIAITLYWFIVSDKNRADYPGLVFLVVAFTMLSTWVVSFCQSSLRWAWRNRQKDKRVSEK